MSAHLAADAPTRWSNGYLGPDHPDERLRFELLVRRYQAARAARVTS